MTETKEASETAGRSKVAQMAAAWANGNVVAREDGTVVNEPADSTADSVNAKPSAPRALSDGHSTGVELGNRARPGMVARSALQQRLPPTVETNSAREAFANFLDATDLPEMRAHFHTAVHAVGLEQARGAPNFYLMLRSALLPKLNFKQKAIFKVGDGGGSGMGEERCAVGARRCSTFTHPPRAWPVHLAWSRPLTRAWWTLGQSTPPARRCPAQWSALGPSASALQ